MNSVINEKIAEILRQPAGPYEGLLNAAKYGLTGGKRVRARLCIAAAQTFGAQQEEALLPAVALELIHAYSLIHDDLPCMDDDDFRRGRPSLHKATSESTALLTGNFLLNLAYEIITTAPYTESQRLDLLNLFAKSSNHLITGQFIDLACVAREIDEETLHCMYLNKTAALFVASVEAGAIIGKASKEERLVCRKFGEYFGLAFQMIDDLQDASPASSDQIKQKPTAVTLFGIGGVQEKIASLHAKAIDCLKALPGNAPPLMAVYDETRL